MFHSYDNFNRIFEGKLQKADGCHHFKVPYTFANVEKIEIMFYTYIKRHITVVILSILGK